MCQNFVCLSYLFVDDTNLFITGNDTVEICAKLDEDLKSISEWLCCNKFSLNVSNTHHMVSPPRSRNISNLNVRINNRAINVQISWKKHIEYTCNKLSQSVGITQKVRKKLHKATFVTLYYSFAYMYPICLYQSGKNQSFAEKKLVRIITSSPYRSHTAPLLLANRLLSVTEINSYMVDLFLYNYINGILPTTFSEHFVRN